MTREFRSVVVRGIAQFLTVLALVKLVLWLYTVENPWGLPAIVLPMMRGALALTAILGAIWVVMIVTVRWLLDRKQLNTIGGEDEQ